jgi:hypothetical protein
MKLKILVGVAAAALVAGATGTRASTIYLGWNTTGGPPVTLLTSTVSPGTVTSATAVGGFSGVTLTGSDFDPLNLGATTIDAATGGTKPIFLFVSETGLSADGSTTLTTGLTENLLSAGWEVDEWAYATEGNTPFTTAGTLLATSDFTTIGTFTSSKTLFLTTPYTLTEVFEIIPGGKPTTLGSDLSTITVSGSIVPESSTWEMMLLGFAGLGYTAFRRTAKGRRAIAGI